MGIIWIASSAGLKLLSCAVFGFWNITFCLYVLNLIPAQIQRRLAQNTSKKYDAQIVQIYYTSFTTVT